MSQLQLSLDIPDAAPVPRGPGLDATTVKHLQRLGFTYLGTHWSAYFKQWHHDIRVESPRGSYRIWKTDAGVAAMLENGKAFA